MKKENSETNEIKRLTIDIPAQLHQELKIKAVLEGVTMANIVRLLLQQSLGGENYTNLQSLK